MFRKLNRPRTASRISEIPLLCALLSAMLAGAAAPRLAAGMDAAGEAARIADALHAEFVKGFRVLDDDGDGAVDFTALVRALRGVGYGKAAAVRRGRGGGNPDLIFEEFDVNEDGVLSGDEPGPFLRESEYFADGEVTLEEYRIAARELARRRGNRGGGGEGRGGGRRRGGGEAVRTSDLEFMAAIDGNDDGALTTAEAREAIEREVRENMDSRASLDGDGDGAVSPREYGLSQPVRGETDADGLDGHARGHFRREDFDGDGSLSVAEIGERTRASLSGRYRAMQLALRLQALDANEDGSLQNSELGGLTESRALRMDAGSGGGALEVGRLYGMLYRLPPERTAELERLLGE